MLLLDEFKDLLERADEFDETFRGQLRSLYNTNRTVALVLATRQPITHIPQLNAYFANGITMHELNPLHPNAAKALLAQPHDHPFSAEEVNLGLQVAKHHPLRLQLVGFQLYFWKTQAPNPLYHAKRLSDHLGGAQIYLKREDLNHTGAHKINNTIGQA